MALYFSKLLKGQKNPFRIKDKFPLIIVSNSYGQSYSKQKNQNIPFFRDIVSNISKRGSLSKSPCINVHCFFNTEWIYSITEQVETVSIRSSFSCIYIISSGF